MPVRRTEFVIVAAAKFHRLPRNGARFIHNENIARYRKLIALGEVDPSRDEARYQMLLQLLAEEEAKGKGSASRVTCLPLMPMSRMSPKVIFCGSVIPH